MNAAASTTNPSNGRNGKVSWTVLISAGSMALAIAGGGVAYVQSQINTLKELTNTDRDAIRRQLSENDRVTESLRHDKLEIARFDQVINRFVTVESQRFDGVQKQIESLNERINRLEQQRHQ